MDSNVISISCRSVLDDGAAAHAINRMGSTLPVSQNPGLAATGSRNRRPDTGRELGQGGYRGYYVFHLGSGLLQGAQQTPNQQKHFSPDGRYVLGLEGTRVILWDSASGKHVHTLSKYAGDVTATAFSPDGRWLATAANDNLARLWDVATGTELHQLAGHGGKVLSVAWSADGRWVVTASEDGTTRLWDAATGRQWLTLTGHRGPVHMVTFRPDSQAVLSGGADGTACEWPVDPLSAAKESLPRQLRVEERVRDQVPSR